MENFGKPSTETPAESESKHRVEAAETFVRAMIDACRAEGNDAITAGHLEDLRAFALGIKPAIYGEWTNAMIWNSPELKARLATTDADIGIYPNLILHRTLIEKRLREEPALAKELGWNEEETIESIAARVNSDDPSRDGLAGFLAGFPASTIRGFIAYDKLGKRERAASSVARHSVVVTAPNGNDVYQFVAFGEHGDQAADVKALQASVDAAYRKLYPDEEAT